MINKFKRSFQAKSFNTKFQILVLVIASFFLVTVFSISCIWRKALVNQLYTNAYREVSTISSNLSDKLSDIQYLTYRIIDNDAIQKLLIEDNARNANQQATRNGLRYQINSITRDTGSVQTAYLINTDNINLINFINNTDNILPELSIEEIVANLPNNPSIGQWHFSENLTRAVYARKIFSTNTSSLDYLGTIILTVDTTFIMREIKKISPYSEDTLFFLRYNNETFTPKLNQKNEIQARQKINSLDLKQSYSRLLLENDIYYVGQRTIDPFSFVYFVPNKNLLKQITNLQILLFSIFSLLFILFFLAINRITKQLTAPISHLAHKMRKLTDMNDLEHFTPLPSPYEEQNEVTILYNSYDAMIHEIKKLIKDNYEMKILSQEIELKALQAQLDPHFLYNTLDSIHWLALENDQIEISDMVTSLAYLFRKKIDNASSFMSLSDEIEIVNAYITIQKFRFQSRLQYHLTLNVVDDSIEIPKFIIQPIVENIFKYAVDKQDTPVSITIDIKQHKEYLQIKISDNGPGFPKDFILEESTGIGLKNIKKRLKLYYGNKGQLSIYSVPFEQTIIKIEIPLNLRR